MLKSCKVWQALTGLLLLLCACGSRESGKPVIAVSFESYKWLVEQIVGDDYEVVALLPEGSDPEMFDPDMATMKALEKANVYMTTNSLGFETQVGERIRANYPNLQVVDLSENIDIIMHTHGVAAQSSHHDHDASEDGHHHGNEAHPTGDPHLLSSLENASIITKNIGLYLTRHALDNEKSEEAERYMRAMMTLQAELDEKYLETVFKLNEKGVLKQGAFVVMHPSLSYYARDYGLTQIPLEVDGKEASPRQLEERLSLAAASNPIALFYERGQSESKAMEIARALGITAYPVSMNGADFVEQIEDVTLNLTK